MNSLDIEERLRSLSQEEIKILAYKCFTDVGYLEIGEIWSVSESWLTQKAAVMYEKLGVDRKLHWRPREEKLKDIYGPMLQSLVARLPGDSIEEKFNQWPIEEPRKPGESFILMAIEDLEDEKIRRKVAVEEQKQQFRNQVHQKKSQEERIKSERAAEALKKAAEEYERRSEQRRLEEEPIIVNTSPRKQLTGGDITRPPIPPILVLVVSLLVIYGCWVSWSLTSRLFAQGITTSPSATLEVTSSQPIIDPTSTISPGTVVFEDDFESGDIKPEWSLVDLTYLPSKSKIYYIVDGRLTSNSWVDMFVGHSLNNFKVEFDYKVDSNYSYWNNKAYVAFNGPDNYVSFVWDYSGGGAWEVPGDTTRDKVALPLNVGTIYGGTDEFSFEAMDGVTKLYINGVEWSRIANPQVDFTQVGITVGRGSSFDNFKIIALP